MGSEDEISLEEQVNALEFFEFWLEDNYTEEEVENIYSELSTIGSEKNGENKINILLYLLDESSRFTSEIEGERFTKNNISYSVKLVPYDKSSQQTQT